MMLVLHIREGCFLHQDHNEEIKLKTAEQQVPENFMDHWILSFTQSLIKFVTEEMAGWDYSTK